MNNLDIVVTWTVYGDMERILLMPEIKNEIKIKDKVTCPIYARFIRMSQNIDAKIENPVICYCFSMRLYTLSLRSDHNNHRLQLLQETGALISDNPVFSDSISFKQTSNRRDNGRHDGRM